MCETVTLRVWVLELGQERGAALTAGTAVRGCMSVFMSVFICIDV